MQPLPQHRTEAGIPYDGRFPTKKRRRAPLVDLAAMDAKAAEENAAREAEEAERRKAEESEEEKRREQARRDADEYINGPGNPAPEPDNTTEPVNEAPAEGAGQDIAAALAAGAAAEAAVAAEGAAADPAPAATPKPARATKQAKNANG